MRRFLVLPLCLFLAVSLRAQEANDVLFTVGDREVTVGEFKYIYDKTNGEAADYSKNSLTEYLDLYQRFKLKVARAYDMGLDTVKVLQQELSGYRRQLADNYLIDRAVTDQLVEELYERRQRDVEISHILFATKKEASAAENESVKRLVSQVSKEVTPENFVEKAAKYSEDQYSKDKGGKIGFLTAPFPNGMYDLETAVYNAEPGTILGPIKTSFGYHLAIVHEKREARGEIEAAHIMFRKDEKGSNAAEAKQKADNVLELLNGGQSFEKLAATMSQDEKTRNNGGYIGFFGINRYEKSFEDAAFGIKEDGGISGVIESKVGFHIIKRISRRSIQPLADERALLTTKVKADGRFQAATDALLDDIRQRAGVKEDRALLGQFSAGLQDTSFLTFKWKAPRTKDKTPLITIGNDYVKTLGDFQEFLQKNSRQRVNFLRKGNSAEAVSSLYADYLKQQLMAYEESKLEDNYPAFRSLMREYEEGILLFEATRMEVWDKASQDSVGLANYYGKHKSDYQWKERAVVTQYTVLPAQSDKIGEIMAAARKGSSEDVLKMFPEGSVKARTDNYEKDRMAQLNNLGWKVNAMSKPEKNPRTGHQSFYKVEKMLPAAPKELAEARGYVIADYQDQLEREWVESLRKEYPVKVKKRVFEKMIKN